MVELARRVHIRIVTKMRECLYSQSQSLDRDGSIKGCSREHRQ